MTHLEPDTLPAQPKPLPMLRPVRRNPRVDRRTRHWRHVKDAIAALTHEASGRGELSQGQLIAIEKAAELLVIARQARALALSGQARFEDVVRLENAATRAMKRLDALNQASPPEELSLSEYIAQHAGKGRK